MDDIMIYAGTYTHGGSGGIHAIRFESQSAGLPPAGLAAAAPNPSYLAVSADKRYLYAALETDEFAGAPGGAVAAYRINGGTGQLEEINRRPALGSAPCHLCVDSANRRLFAANYGDGTVSAFPLMEDGSVGPAELVIRHDGSGPVLDRQAGPHAHFVALAPGERFLCAVDLGCDSVFVYPLDPDTGVSAACLFTLKMKPGSGPRHMAFHPSGKFAYVLTELSNEVAAFAWLPEGGFTELQYLSALPVGFTGESWCAAVRVSPCGLFLYASNRGHDSIAVFSIESGTGLLTPVQIAPCGGEWPRDIALDPAGRFLFAACERSHNVALFSVDGQTGEIQHTGRDWKVPSPACVAIGPDCSEGNG